MTEPANQWMLFGLDMRQLGHLWSAAFRDLFFADGSPVRQRLDEPVLLFTGTEVRQYQGGMLTRHAQSDDQKHNQERNQEDSQDGQLPHDHSVQQQHCTARLVPDAYVLTRELSVPLVAEAELPAVIDMEVAAGSPFAAADTVYGWTESARDDATLSVALAIASRVALQRWLRESPVEGYTEPENPELWAQANGVFLTLRGFGESRRESAYKKRLIRCGVLCGAVMLLGLLSVSLFTLQQRLMLERVTDAQNSISAEAGQAASLRERLVSANETIRAADALLKQYPNPHLEIARLSQLLGDGVFVAHFSANGRQLRVRGRADDAASVMQTLAETEAYSRVTAPQAITSVGTDGDEQFYLDIDLAPDSAIAPTSDDES